MKYVLLLFLFVGCATKPVPRPKPRPQTWAEKKRECHTYYLNRFGLSSQNSIGICKEELERTHN